MPVPARTLSTFPVALRTLEVARVTRITPGMCRVTLSGAELGALTAAHGTSWPAFSSPGFDDDICLLFPYPGEAEPVLPVIVDGRVTFARGRRPLARAYTVRRYDAARGALDVDIVLHAEGVASSWARTTRPGEPMHIAGPGRSATVPTAVHLLVLGDETALPAIARLMEELPRDARGDVLIAVAHDEDVQELHEPPGMTVQWLRPAPGAAPSSDPVREALDAIALRDDRTFAWVAGEQSEVARIRRYLTRERGLDPAALDATGYWKRGRP